MDETDRINDQRIVVEQPELNTGLDDDTLNHIIDSRIQESKSVYDAMKLDERRETNREYWLPHHFKTGQKKTFDNVIWQDTEHRISIAVGRMPDIVVVPGSRELQSRDKAKILERVLDMDFSTKQKKRLMKNGLRHNHLYFMAILKPTWNPSKGTYGDYEFNLVDPRKVLISHTGTIPEDGFTADNCDLIVENIEEPVARVLAKFPGKSQQLKQLLMTSDPSRLATTMKYQEVWYTYHDSSGQILEGVCWRYNHLILRNIKNPYFDFQGYNKIVYDREGKPVVNMFGQVQSQQTFRNFFERPRKPYIFFSYQNLGDSPIDSTSAVEQAIPLQRHLNKTLNKIEEINNGVTSKVAANRTFSQDQLRNFSSNSQDHLWGDTDEDVRSAITTFTNDPASPGMYNDLQQTKQAIDAKFNTQGATRGEPRAAESGISKQITREGDLVVSDDIVEIVLERVMEEAASWAIQFMKMMYVQPHFKSKMGKDGEVIQEWIQQDMIDDGIALSVKGSTTDKRRTRSEAIQRAEAGVIDPLTMLEDMDVANPQEQALRTILFKMGEGEGGDAFARYLKISGLQDKMDEAEQDDPSLQSPQNPQVPPQSQPPVIQ